MSAFTAKKFLIKGLRRGEEKCKVNSKNEGIARKLDSASFSRRQNGRTNGAVVIRSFVEVFRALVQYAGNVRQCKIYGLGYGMILHDDAIRAPINFRRILDFHARREHLPTFAGAGRQTGCEFRQDEVARNLDFETVFFGGGGGGGWAGSHHFAGADEFRYSFQCWSFCHGVSFRCSGDE